MSKTTAAVLIGLGVLVLFVGTILIDNRIAAGGGALLLLVGLIYGFVRTRGGSPEEIARAEAGARKVREELAEDEVRRGEQ